MDLIVLLLVSIARVCPWLWQIPLAAKVRASFDPMRRELHRMSPRFLAAAVPKMRERRIHVDPFECGVRAGPGHSVGPPGIIERLDRGFFRTGT